MSQSINSAGLSICPVEATSDPYAVSKESPVLSFSPTSVLSYESSDSYSEAILSPPRDEGSFQSSLDEETLSSYAASNSPEASQESPASSLSPASVLSYGSSDTYQNASLSPSGSSGPLQFGLNNETYIYPFSFRNLFNATSNPEDRGSDHRGNENSTLEVNTPVLQDAASPHGLTNVPRAEASPSSPELQVSDEHNVNDKEPPKEPFVNVSNEISTFEVNTPVLQDTALPHSLTNVPRTEASPSSPELQVPNEHNVNDKEAPFVNGSNEPSTLEVNTLVLRDAASPHSLTDVVNSLSSSEPQVSEEYEVDDEELPNDPYFNPSFQKALKIGTHIAGSIEDALRACKLSQDPESQLHKLVNKSNQLRKFQTPSVCTIGVVGDSGVGKSSLVNSLLHETGLASAAGLGAACTSVVTEYRLCKREHVAKYTFEIDCMTDDEIDDQLRELVWSCRQHSKDPSHEHATQDEINKLNEQTKVARDTLQAAFGSHQNFNELITNIPKGAEKEIPKQLRSWIDESWPSEMRNNGWSGTAGTVGEYHKKTKNFLDNHWPFVKVIRVYLSSQVLKSGAVIADLPGFNDSNHARVKAAQDYIYHCDEMLVVADIGRVTANRNVEDLLEKNFGHDLANSKPSQGIALVCTKSEEINKEEIKETFSGKGLDPDRVPFLENEIQEADANDEEPGSLRRRNKAQEELECLLMTARNKHIKELVLQKNAQRLKNKPLHVFCVSNKLYGQYKKKGKKYKSYMTMSGIPELRQFCHQIPAGAQFRVAEHYLNVRLKLLVQSVRLWLTAGSKAFHNDATIRHLLDTVHKNLTASVAKAAGSKEKAVENIIRSQMEHHTQAWTRFAYCKVERMSGYHHSTLAAICRNYGSYRTNAAVANDLKDKIWNLEFIEAMGRDLSGRWDKLCERCDITFDKLRDSITEGLDGLTVQVKDFHGAPVFAKAIQTNIKEVDNVISTIQDEFEDKLEKIWHCATGNQQSSYIFQEMLPTWRECAHDSGTGVTVRRLSRIKGAIGTDRAPVLFPALRERVVNSLLELSRQTCYKLKEKLGQVLDRVLENLDILKAREARFLLNHDGFMRKLEMVVRAASDDMLEIKDTVKSVREAWDARRAMEGAGYGRINQLNE